MLTDSQKTIVRHIIEDMRYGSEITLEQINALNGVQVFQLYTLYEFVHDVLRESPRLYKFSKEKNLNKSIIYRHEEYNKI